MAKDSFYFKHDRNARNDMKLVKVRRKYQLEGYGAYFALIEILSEEDGYKLPVTDIKFIAIELNVAEELLVSVINDFDLFKIKNGFFFSPSLLRKMEEFENIKAKRAAAGRKGGTLRVKNLLKQNSSKTQALKEKIREDNKENKENKETTGEENNDTGTLPPPPGDFDNFPENEDTAVTDAADTLNTPLTLNDTRARALTDQHFINAFYSMGIDAITLSGWLGAFNRWLLFRGEKKKLEKDYRTHFTSWIRAMPFTTMNPELYDPAQAHWNKPPKVPPKEPNSGDEKFRIEMEKIRQAKTTR